MALTPQQIAQAQGWINQEWGIPGQAAQGDINNGLYSAAFDPSGTYNFGDTSRNYGVLGAGQAMGYDANDMSQILGLPAADITAYGRANQPQSDAYAGSFNATFPGATNQPQAQPPSVPGMSVMPDWAGGGYESTANPYLTSQADDIQRRTQAMLGEAFQGIQGNAVGAGGLGGTRQGVAQSQAGAKAADFMSGNLANLYGTDWNNSQNRNLSRYGMDQNAYLGNQGQQLGFYNTQRGLDLEGLRTGASLYNLGSQGEWSGLQNANDIYGTYRGAGNTQTTSQTSGGGTAGLIGGLLQGGAYAANRGWWG